MLVAVYLQEAQRSISYNDCTLQLPLSQFLLLSLIRANKHHQDEVYDRISSL